MNNDIEEIEEAIDSWFTANRQQALDNLLIAVWRQVGSNNYTISEILRSFVKYVNQQKLNKLASELEEIAIRIEEQENNTQFTSED